MHGLRTLALPLIAGLSVSLSSTPVEACGGTFCDTGPTAMPVDQTGENILFVMADGIVEAHVQIQYAGDPEKFAWIVPMQAEPTISVGSQQLFTNLLNGTVPSYGFTTQRDQCGDQSNLRGAPGANFSSGDAASGEDDGVDVLSRQTVGSFQTETIQGTSADAVVTWLNDNGYQQIDTAPAILQRYIDKNFVFVAIKLTAGAGIDEIHPLVFSYQGGEPCVPLELTAIAAVDDMAVRTFFLGENRVVPSNYRHVLVNPIKIDWLSMGANYRDVLSRAVDVDGADGQAFVTEYAGPSSVVAGNFVSPTWNPSLLATAPAARVIDELEIQGFLYCDTGYCEFYHPLILPLLQDHLPRPAGVTDQEFYGCVSCYPEAVTTWDAAAFAADVESRIIAPAIHAADLLERNPYVTRMFTLISPYEMTLDPMFAEHEELADVPLPGLATQRITCDGFTYFELPDGRRVAIGSDGAWPSFDEMADAVKVEEYESAGEPVLLADNAADIERELDDHNARYFDDGGCGCRVKGRSTSSTSSATWFGVVAATLLAARRRRTPRPITTG